MRSGVGKNLQKIVNRDVNKCVMKEREHIKIVRRSSEEVGKSKS
jgi:hypothetical protein